MFVYNNVKKQLNSLELTNFKRFFIGDQTIWIVLLR